MDALFSELPEGDGPLKNVLWSDMLTPLRFKVNLLFSKLNRKNYFIILSGSRFFLLLKFITDSSLHQAPLFIGQEIHAFSFPSQGLP